MVVVVLYLLAILGALIYASALACLPWAVAALPVGPPAPVFLHPGGWARWVTYCLRSVYYHKAVKKDWDTDWLV